MKKILIVILLLLTVSSYATNYHFANSGNDVTGNGSLATPYATITKFNSMFLAGTFNAGDSINFKSNDIFYGTLTISENGTMGSPIIIGSYGSGNKPIITGFTTISTWVNEGSNIYSKVISGESSPKLLTFDNANVGMARTPNTGYYKMTSSGTTTTLISTFTNSGTTNWTNANVVIKKNRWVTDRGLITNHSSNTITYSGGSTYASPINWGFFIQNDVRCLDQLGEWVYSGGKLYVYFAFELPASHSIQLVTLNRLISLSSRSYISFINLSLQGSNTSAINISNSNNILVTNCDVNFSGTNGITSTSSSYITVTGCNITNSNNSAFNASSSTYNNSFTYNTVSNSLLNEGMDGNGDGMGMAVVCNGNTGIVSHNSVVNSGYMGISFSGNNTIIRANYVDTFCTLKDDGGGIYTFMWTPSVISGERIVDSNIVINGIGRTLGTNSSILYAEGIYFDGYSEHITAMYNTVSNCSDAGFYIQGYDEFITLKYNTSYNNTTQIHFSSFTTKVPNNVLIGNTFAAKTNAQKLINFSQTSGNFLITQLGTWDSNYYIKPFGTSSVAKDIHYISGKVYNLEYSYEYWKANFDTHAFTDPLILPKYTLNTLTSSNKVTNGTFTSNISGASSTYTNGVAVLSWDNTNKISGGSCKLQISSLSTSTNRATIQFSIGSLSATNYILRFSVLSNSNNESVGVHIQQSVSPWTNITGTKYFNTTTSALTYEVLLNSYMVSSNNILVFTVNDAIGTIYLDNVELYTANVTVTDPDNFLKFEVNNTDSDTTVNFVGSYLDKKMLRYNESITLLPLVSSILFRDATYIPSSTITRKMKYNNKFIKYNNKFLKY